MYDKSLVTKERLDALKIKRDERRAQGFEKAEATIGKEGAEALKYLYDLYDEGMYLWMAALWEPEIGAFYFSNSGRDTESFLPDIESTVQAMRFLDASGLTAYNYEKKDEKMHQPIVKFAKSLQDPDGYFYHSQWGKDITVSRRGRDLGWARNIILLYGGTPDYPTPLDKQGDRAESTLLPEHLQSIENFRAYLAERPLRERSYAVGNLIQAQIGQIKAAGDEFVEELKSWYVANQNLENGTWNDELNYHATNGLMKVCLAYSAIEAPIPNPELALNSAVAMILSELPDGQITSFYNPWITVSMIINNLKKFGKAELADKLRQDVLDKASDMIRHTADKVRNFKREDGSYSYGPKGSCGTSQGAPVSYARVPEGDINGNCLATTGVVSNVCRALGIEVIPLFCKEDGELFFELIDKSYPSSKIYPAPPPKE